MIPSRRQLRLATLFSSAISACLLVLPPLLGTVAYRGTNGVAFTYLILFMMLGLGNAIVIVNSIGTNDSAIAQGTLEYEEEMAGAWRKVTWPNTLARIFLAWFGEGKESELRYLERKSEEMLVEAEDGTV